MRQKRDILPFLTFDINNAAPTGYLFVRLQSGRMPADWHNGNGKKRFVFALGNGTNFGEVNAVRDFLQITSTIGKPKNEHPKRRITGLQCPRSEVSGRRLWGMFADKFGTADKFFAGHFVWNYCPLLFLAQSGANITPDKLPKAETAPLFAMCDEFLQTAAEILKPKFYIGIGAFAESRLRVLFGNQSGAIISKILHPSPASPAANKNFPATAEKQLKDIGVW